MSNGSERTPERCVHAPVGPDWAGLREPSSWKERALAAEAENERLDAQIAKGGTIVRKAGDLALTTPLSLQQATEALTFTTDVWRRYKAAEAERDALLAMEQRLTDHIVQLAAERDAAQHIIESHRCGENVELAYRRTLEAQAERDALRAQLDSMTVETRRSRVRADAPPLILKIVDERRLVSPWTKGNPMPIRVEGTNGTEPVALTIADMLGAPRAAVVVVEGEQSNGQQ